MRVVAILFLLVQMSCEFSAQKPLVKQQPAERKMFSRSSVELKSPKSYLNRDGKNGAYDPRPQILEIDKKKGKYEFRWIGYDGKQKIVEYQRHDALDAIVEARVERTGDRRFVYTYLVKNLPTSPTYLHDLTVQTFSSDIKDEHIPTRDDIMVGHMAKYIPQFSEGIWRRFIPLGEIKPKIHPGSSIEFKIVSLSRPGLVECKATAGDITLKGVGEHMPTELEKAMPGFDELASCLTIGPDERLASLTQSGKVKYLLDNLSKFVEAGWMAGDTPRIYEDLLRRNDLVGAYHQAKNDLKSEFVTNEVFYIIEGLLN